MRRPHHARSSPHHATARALSAVLLLATGLAAQQATDAAEDGVDWRMPFRAPDREIEPPADVWVQLDTMLAARERVAPSKVSFDGGREIVDDPDWRAAREKLLTTRLDAGYLSLLIRESDSVRDRRLSMYGMFYVTDPAVVFQMIEHIPGEPVRELREEAFPRAIEFAAAHLAKRNSGDLSEWLKIKVGPSGERPPRPGEFSFGFDLAPFHALLAVDDWRDHAQALWFLARTAELRADTQEVVLEGALPFLRKTLTSEHEEVRHQAFALLATCDPTPDDIPTAAPDGPSDEQLTDWFERVRYEVFPPIRVLSDGLVEMWPSEDLDRIVAVGSRALSEGTVGVMTSGQDSNKSFYRGLELGELPEPLDKLGLERGSVVTAVNGSPVTSSADLLVLIERAIEGAAKRSPRLIVEYVREGKRLAREFRVQRP